MIVGITGGLACGKSTAGKMFGAEGFGVVDADAVVRDLLDGDSEVREAVASRYDGRAGGREGAVDRAALAEIVFSSREELMWLETLLHLRVVRAWRERVAGEPGRPWAVQVPLLFEVNLQGEFDVTVCVAADPAVARERLDQCAMPSRQVEARMARQFSVEKKMERADYVIENSGSSRFLRDQIVPLIREEILMRERQRNHD